MTNVPGPREALYFAGKKIENFIGWVPTSGRVGMGISIFSYAGKVGIGLVTDEGLVPDPEAILKYFEEELDYLHDISKTGNVDVTPLIVGYTGEAAAKSVKSVKRKTRPEMEEAGAPADSHEKSKGCIARTKSGSSCKKKPAPGSQFCSVHQPEVKR